MVKKTKAESSQKTKTNNKQSEEDSDSKPKVKRSKKTRNEKMKEAIKEIESPKAKTAIYVGHLPWGFQDESLKKYFAQFGEISRIITPKSKNTGRSKGYAFIEFKDEQTAAIAAKTMDNYILFDKVLKCNVIEETSKYDRIFRRWKKKYKFDDKYKKHLQLVNKKKSDEEIKNRIQMLVDKEKKKRERFEEMGIDYDFPGFEKVIEQYRKEYKNNDGIKKKNKKEEKKEKVKDKKGKEKEKSNNKAKTKNKIKNKKD